MKTNIEMAREADPKSNLSEPYCLDHETRAWLERFAALVRADEREACAKVCEEVAVDSYTKIGMAHEPYMKATAEDCARHIRARGQSQVCCGEYNTCVRPCTPRGRHHGQKEEREACAKVCDAEEKGANEETWYQCAKALAKQIRARGQA
jgi:hypothetical protein